MTAQSADPVEADWRPVVDVRHVPVNPSEPYIGVPPFLQRCREQEAEGFGLVRVVAVSQFLAIAVFERRP